MLRLFTKIIDRIMNPNIHVSGDRALVNLKSNVSVNGDAYFDVSKGGYIEIGEGTVLQQGVIFASFGGRIKVGRECSFNPYCVIYGHGGLEIGDYVRVAAHSVIIPANHKFENLESPIYQQGLSKLGIKIHDNIWIGAGSKILDGVHIHSGAVIAAGSVVTKDVEGNAVYGGVPAALLKYRS